MRISGQRSDESALPLIGVYEISKVLGATLDLDKALHEVLNILSAYLNMRHGAVLLNDESGQLCLAAVTGMSLQLAREGALKYPFTAAAKVVSTGIPMVAANAVDEPLLAEYVSANAALEVPGRQGPKKGQGHGSPHHQVVQRFRRETIAQRVPGWRAHPARQRQKDRQRQNHRKARCAAKRHLAP